MKHDSLKNIKGIIFDKDGTLFDFNSVWSVWCDRVLDDLSDNNASLKNSLAESIGYDANSKTFIAGSLIVSATAQDTAKALADQLPALSLREVNDVCVKHLDNLPLTPISGLEELLTKLKAASIKLGVATNDLESAAVSQLTETKIKHHFDFICGCDSGFGSKPAAGMIHAFCKATELPPTEVAMVGDSLHDINAGKAAQTALNIGVLTGPATEQELSPKADIVLPNATALKTLLSL